MIRQQMTAFRRRRGQNKVLNGQEIIFSAPAKDPARARVSAPICLANHPKMRRRPPLEFMAGAGFDDK
jgi:hypothetical protein